MGIVATACLLLLQANDTTAELVERLGSDEIEVREEAAHALGKLGAPVRPAVEAATRHSDPEIAGRAKEILVAIARVEWEKAIAPDVKGAKKQYVLAERYFQAGDFEKAMILCRRAVEQEPGHAQAKALLIELQFITGRVTLGVELPAHPAGNQQVMVEIDQLLARSARQMNKGQLGKAEKNLRLILEYARWIEEGVKLRVRKREAELRLRVIEKKKGPVR